jgi:hypothetical protein
VRLARELRSGGEDYNNGTTTAAAAAAAAAAAGDETEKPSLVFGEPFATQAELFVAAPGGWGGGAGNTGTVLRFGRPAAATAALERKTPYNAALVTAATHHLSPHAHAMYSQQQQQRPMLPEMAAAESAAYASLLREVGRYKLNSVDPQLESDWFRPSNLSSAKPVSNLSFKMQLAPLRRGAVRPRHGGHERRLRGVPRRGGCTSRIQSSRPTLSLEAPGFNQPLDLSSEYQE